MIEIAKKELNMITNICTITSLDSDDAEVEKIMELLSANDYLFRKRKKPITPKVTETVYDVFVRCENE